MNSDKKDDDKKQQQNKNEEPDRTPKQAEGDEKTVDEALKNADKKR